MPEIVEANVRQARTLEEWLEVPAGDGLVIVRCALSGGEYKPAIRPVSARPKLFLCLPLTVASEGFYGPLRQVYGATAGVLRFGEYERSLAASFTFGFALASFLSALLERTRRARQDNVTVHITIEEGDVRRTIDLTDVDLEDPNVREQISEQMRKLGEQVERKPEPNP